MTGLGIVSMAMSLLLVVDGTAFGQPASGIRADTQDFAGLDAFVLVDSANVERFRPRAGTEASEALTADEVKQILVGAVSTANRARAQIRRPTGSPARVTISVVDSSGVILGVVRTRDAPVFGIDVSLQKARTAAFFSSAQTAVAINALAEPLKPRVAATLPMNDLRSVALQFRYLFAVDATGLNVIDVTHPAKPRLVAGARVPLEDGHKLFVARTFAYVAAGKAGLAIVDIERAEKPKLYATFNADGKIADARDVVVATTNASLFAYVADGKSGLKVIQLTSPESQPRFYGFSPDPKPELIAWYATRVPALSLSRPLERDRAVDETGGQVAVFGRRGARPFNLVEMHSLYLDENGDPWFVDDDAVPATPETQRDVRITAR